MMEERVWVEMVDELLGEPQFEIDEEVDQFMHCFGLFVEVHHGVFHTHEEVKMLEDSPELQRLLHIDRCDRPPRRRR